MLTSGAIEALELVGKAFVDSGDRVLVEAPTYLGAIMAFQGFEAQVDGVPLDDDGLDVDELERMLSSGRGAEAPVHDPRLPEPCRREPLGRAARGARRARAPPRPARHRGRCVPRALFRGGAAAEPLEPRARRRRAGGDVLEDVLPRRPPRLGGGAGRHRGEARLGEAEHRPVRGRAGPAAAGGIRAPRAPRPPDRAGARPLQGQAGRAPRSARPPRRRACDLDAAAGRFLRLARARRGRSMPSRSPARRSRRASPSSPGRRSSRPAGASAT